VQLWRRGWRDPAQMFSPFLGRGLWPNCCDQKVRVFVQPCTEMANSGPSLAQRSPTHCWISSIKSDSQSDMSLKGEGFCAVLEERTTRSCTNVLTFPRPGPMADLLRSKGEGFCAAFQERKAKFCTKPLTICSGSSGSMDRRLPTLS